MNRNKREQREFDRKRKLVISQLHQLERRAGVELARSAMRKHLELVRQEDVRVRKITQLQEELDAIRQKR